MSDRFKVGDRPIPFKKDMKDAIVEGRKTMTTRTYKLTLGFHTAVSDSSPFAVIKVLKSIETTWKMVTEWHFREEGFESPEEMKAWAKANGLGHYETSTKKLYRHPYELIEVLPA